MTFTEPPARPEGMTFDGPDRIVAPDPPASQPLVYSTSGERLLAADPARDLSGRGFGNVLRVQATADWLYVLDDGHRVWRVAR